jgi:hypothetical protein
VSTQNPWRSALVSWGFTAWTITATVLAFAAADNALTPFATFLAWLAVHWWAMLAGLIINPAPIYRARQSILNAQNPPPPTLLKGP